MDIIVTGSLGYDYIMNFSGRFADRIMPDKIHKISLSFLVDTLEKQFGGTAGNIAYTLNLLGSSTAIVAASGKDFAPYKAFLAKHKISTRHIAQYSNVGTSSYFVVTDDDDNQIGSFYTGAMRYAKALDLPLSGKPAIVVIAPNDPEAMRRYVRACQSRHTPYLYDPAFQIATFTPEELRTGITGSAITIGNDYEIALIEERLAISHEELRVMVPVVVTTLGPKGSIIETKTESMHIKPAKPKKVVDPTGAGDAFRAGFLAGYLRSFDLATCGQMGSVASVYTVEKYGTQTHTFTQKEFLARYTENFGTVLRGL
ncbi:MAG: carbohydrate kinase family protein [bacterium]|nr:carbohydrate kinase family protein [bacterium]